MIVLKDSLIIQHPHILTKPSLTCKSTNSQQKTKLFNELTHRHQMFPTWAQLGDSCRGKPQRLSATAAHFTPEPELSDLQLLFFKMFPKNIFKSGEAALCVYDPKLWRTTVLDLRTVNSSGIHKKLIKDCVFSIWGDCIAINLSVYYD